MRQPRDIPKLQFAFFLLLFSISWAACAQSQKNFIQCLLQESGNSTAISEVIYTPENSSYPSILDFYIQNLRLTSAETPKPQVIITPVHESQIQATVRCSRKHGLQIRIRSGGHDFEGLSYVSEVAFVILDMFNFRSISIDAESRTAWVGTGATLGELYSAIHLVNSTLAFPGGYWPTVAVGGLIGGGGYGPLLRRYGLAADNVIDARVIDVNSRILDRESMGEDYFWAIRGGVSASFGVVLAYRIKLVDVPRKITAFTLKRTLEQNATKLVHKWQSVAPKLPAELLLSLELISISSNQTHNNRTIQATFHGSFHGGVDQLLPLMEERFPELGVSRDDCTDMSYIQYYVYYIGLPIDSALEVLQSRVGPAPKVYFKSKSDFFQKPIPEEGLEDIWDMFFRVDARAARMEWTPFGGRMDEIQESEIPFPHRAGNLFIVYKKVQWTEMSKTLCQERIKWMRKLHSMMRRYASNNPRGIYANYRDLDLGINNIGKTTVEQARVWGAPYFKDNFDRLVKVKTMVDPQNFFRNEQSIPPFSP